MRNNKELKLVRVLPDIISETIIPLRVANTLECTDQLTNGNLRARLRRRRVLGDYTVIV